MTSFMIKTCILGNEGSGCDFFDDLKCRENPKSKTKFLVDRKNMHGAFFQPKKNSAFFL